MSGITGITGWQGLCLGNRSRGGGHDTSLSDEADPIVQPPIDWSIPLRYRRGSPQRLRGLDVFYDFDWNSYFPDRRAQFRNGLCLAKRIIEECPAEKRPALLLTKLDDVEEGPVETETHFVVVLRFPRYLDIATADAAASYFANSLDAGIIGASRLRGISRDPRLVKLILEEHLNLDAISTWAGQNRERMDQLRKLAGSVISTDGIDVGSLAVAIEALETLDPQVVSAIEGLLGKTDDRDATVAFLTALTNRRRGRYLTSEVLGDRIRDRLDDARNAAAEYQRLLATSSTNETALQSYIQEHPWLLGLDYIRVRSRHQVPRGALDFILERYDGYHDLLELKEPHDPIVNAPDSREGVPPSASLYAISPALAQALAQIHVYEDVLTEDSQTVEKLFGIARSQRPRLMIIIGQAKSLPDHRARVLRRLNLSFHRVEIIPYDVIGRRAEVLLANVERYLSDSA